MGNIAISVENLGKCYRIGHAEQRPENFRAAIKSFVSAPFEYLRFHLREPSEDELFWALKDVSFEVRHGEVLGIIGRNGAGKSTLLKILSRITEPTEGRARVYGRVGSLLEVGTGFHPELTGRENIYLNGTILGMKRAEIDKKFDEIVDFSGIEKFLDTPVKRYSSGMYVRLAFAVAANLEPEILLVDEVLAVGDATFQKKCLGKLEDISSVGKTVIFVSHNMYAIQELCLRGVVLEQGKITFDCSIKEAVSFYLQQSNRYLHQSYQKKIDVDESASLSDACLLEAEILNAVGQPCEYLHFGEPFAVRMVWKHNASIRGGSYALRIYDAHNRFLCATNTIKTSAFNENPGIYHLVCSVMLNLFVPGEYCVAIGCYIRPHTTVYVIDPCLRIIIQDIPHAQNTPFNIIGNPIFAIHASWKNV